jgi:hypothetical protein
MNDNLKTVLDCLRGQKSEARERYGIEFVGIVGSVARGEETPTSDIDVLINVVGHTTYFRIGELEADLEERLGRHVDLVDRKTLQPALQTNMERDLVPV